MYIYIYVYRLIRITCHINRCDFYFRIDFDDFLFNQPIKNDNTSAFLCGPDLDLLSLSVVGLPALKLFTLCGDLTGQHSEPDISATFSVPSKIKFLLFRIVVYLPAKDYDAPILKTLLPNKLILTVLSASVQLPGARKPSWSIKLTQLPCPETEKKNRSKKPTRGLGKYHLGTDRALSLKYR